MSSTFDINEHGRGKTLTIGRYAGPDDGTEDRIRYQITDVYGHVADDIPREALAELAGWILAELVKSHLENR
jgi:hypothetical protein